MLRVLARLATEVFITQRDRYAKRPVRVAAAQ